MAVFEKVPVSINPWQLGLRNLQRIMDIDLVFRCLNLPERWKRGRLSKRIGLGS